MTFFNWSTITAMIFMLVILFLLWKDRKNIERQGIVFLRRTERGIKVLDKIANFCPRLWKILSTLGVFLAFILSIFIFFFLLANIINHFIAEEAQPGLALVLPTLSTEFKLLPGAFLVPFWYWIIGIFFLVLVHEGMHGVIGRLEKFKISSVGWAVIGILPAAFVEPEGEQNIHSKKDKGKRTKKMGKEKIKVEGSWQGGTFISRLRVLSAGSLGNFLLALILGLLIISVTTTAYGGREITGMFEHTGIKITGIANNSPAEKFNIPENIIITHVNGVRVNNIIEFKSALKGLNVGDTVTLEGKNNTYRLVTTNYPELNLTYNGKVKDYIFAYIEPIFPVIELTGKNDHPLIKLARWKWVKESFNFLEEKANKKINKTKEELKNKPYLGITVSNEVNLKENVAPFAPLIFFIYSMISFIAVINIGVGLANLLPLKPLDGGFMWEDLLKKVFPRKGEKINSLLGIITLILILTSLGVNFL